LGVLPVELILTDRWISDYPTHSKQVETDGTPNGVDCVSRRPPFADIRRGASLSGSIYALLERHRRNREDERSGKPYRDKDDGILE
jgi:hypothetical protein